MIGTIVGFVGSKLGWLLGGLGVAALVAIGKRIIPGLLAKKTGQFLSKVLDPNTADSELKKRVRDFALASVRIAEHIIPDRGQGAKRKEFVSLMLQKVFRKSQADALSDLIEEAVVRMDEELKKASQ